ncbi:MAG: hypothetical protein AABW56_01295 [Nanoarchaeota archaeon]
MKMYFGITFTRDIFKEKELEAIFNQMVEERKGVWGIRGIDADDPEHLMHILYDSNNIPYIIFINHNTKKVQSELDRLNLKPVSIKASNLLGRVMQYIEEGKVELN